MQILKLVLGAYYFIILYTHIIIGCNFMANFIYLNLLYIFQFTIKQGYEPNANNLHYSILIFTIEYRYE